MGRRALGWLLVALLAAGCAGATTNPSTPPPSAVADATTAPASTLTAGVPAASPAPKPASNATLTGKGSKKGGPVVLEGDYVLRTKVALRRGCDWKMYLDGLDTEPLDAVKTNAGGTHSTETDETGIDLRSYRIRVTSSLCGSWSVSLARK
jgi:hypothetical protein